MKKKTIYKRMLAMGIVAVISTSMGLTSVYAENALTGEKIINAEYATSAKTTEVLSGLCKSPVSGRWFYYTNNKVDTTYTGLAKNQYGWWYVKNGKLDLTYTGLAKNEYGWWYVKEGKLDRTYTGLAKNEYGWWYAKNGKLDLTYTGMAKNDYGWWYVKNGKLDLTYTGIATNQYGTWYMQKGRFTSSFNGTVTFDGMVYTIVKGKVTSTIPQEPENKMSVVLTAPNYAMINETFSVSVSITNCPNVEWYINGEYDASLAKKINPEGTLQFTEQGFYRITVIGYSEDWTENVHDEVTVQVYTDPSQLNGNAKEHERAMYSWNHDYIYEEHEMLLQKVMEMTECNILYQEISSKADAKDVADFLQRRGENGQQVYYLCGNASWAIEEGATSMLKEVQRAIEYNKAAGEYKFVGIQFDVEPYCLLDFEENAVEYMAIYVENSKLAYQAAHEAGLLVEICIPYYWDSSYEFYDELEDLIANACDRVVVMNYYKKNKEAIHISHELELCKKYDKPIINITETIPPGQHELTEDNTYYHDGIDAIETMWNSLDGYFQYDKLGYAFHYLDIIIELLGLE